MSGHRDGARGLSGVLIRPGTVADAEAIARVLVAGWRAGYRGLVPGDVLASLDERERADRWREILPDAIVLVAERGGEVVGVASVAAPARELDEPGVGEVTAFYVDPRHWRRGVGRALMDAAGAELRDEGCDVVVLWVFEGNDAGRAFYAALGFQRDGARRANARLELPEIRLRARLD